MPIFDVDYLAGIPAPLWLVLFLKVLGFVLHLVPMGLWAVALPIGLVGATSLPESSGLGRFGRNILRQMPILVALGVNFGIVPLLFIQTLYPKPFYTATVLIAWHWFVIIPLFLIAYYGVYVASFAVKPAANSILRRALLPVGIVASVCFLAIGLLISNAMTLIVHIERWNDIFVRTQIAGAVSGLGSNMSDPSLLYRLLTMFALAVMTTGVWAMVDACLFAKGSRGANASYRCWASRFAAATAVVGAVILWCVQMIPHADYTQLFWVVAVVGTALLAGIVVVVIRSVYGVIALSVITTIYVALLTTFGIIRQIGQHTAIVQTDGLANLTEHIQWTPVALFLVTFVLGVLCIVWMVRQLVLAPPETAN
ncbi:MAG: hypothetical protein LBU65_17090 [Planctomycetaceae bacterium]|jgi:hypothetical protein|nr:hypothetical protein [Planctomycetaceae bacterium]